MATFSTESGWPPYPKVTGVQTDAGRVATKPLEQDKMKCSVCGMTEDGNPAHASDYEGEGKHDFKAATKKSYGDDLLVSAPFGALKSLPNGGFEGYLVRFTDADHPDLTGDYFTKSTEFFMEDGDSLPILYDHGLDATVKRRKIGRATIKTDDVGVWIKGQVKMADEYAKAIYDELVVKGKAGLSSGAASHLTSRKKSQRAGVHEIAEWGFAEGSITPMPTEPSTRPVLAIKSLATYADEDLDDSHDFLKSVWEAKGGAGSGNFGHSGRPGEKGGSSSEGGGTDSDKTKTASEVKVGDKILHEGKVKTVTSSWDDSEMKPAGGVPHQTIRFKEGGGVVVPMDSKVSLHTESKEGNHEKVNPEDIKKGDKILTGTGKVRQVEFVTQTHKEYDDQGKGIGDPSHVSIRFKNSGGGQVIPLGKGSKVTRVKDSTKALPGSTLALPNKPHKFEEDDEDENSCAICGKAEDDKLHDAAPSMRRPMKGIFEEELAEVTPSVWQLRDALSEVCSDIAAAKRTETISGGAVDVRSKVTEAVTEYAARLIPLISTQIEDYIEAADTPGARLVSSESGRFYLRSLPDEFFNSNLQEFVVVKSLVPGEKLDGHSARAVTAYEEFANLATGLLTSTKTWLARVKSKIEFRRNDPTKAGRVISEATLNKLSSVHGHMGSAITAAQEAHTHLGDLMKLAQRKTGDSDENTDEEKSLSYEQVTLMLTSAKSQTELALAEIES